MLILSNESDQSFQISALLSSKINQGYFTGSLTLFNKGFKFISSLQLWMQGFSLSFNLFLRDLKGAFLNVCLLRFYNRSYWCLSLNSSWESKFMIIKIVFSRSPILSDTSDRTLSTVYCIPVGI